MSKNKFISYILCNKGIIVNLYKLYFYFLTFLFSQLKEFFILTLFHPSNQTHFYPSNQTHEEKIKYYL